MNYFALAAILGDNFEVTRLVQSFVVDYCCQFCEIHYNVLNNIYHERFCALRASESYNRDIQFNNIGETGIHKACIFNVPKSFDMIDNLACDVMHDLLEGVFQYKMGLLIHKFIQKKLFRSANFK